MKTNLIKKTISIFVILIFAASISFASTSPRKSTTDLKTIITRTVTYPEFAKENNLSGFVVISFHVDENGKIILNELNSNSVYFQVYVENKLKEIQIKNPDSHTGKTYYYRFDFELLK